MKSLASLCLILVAPPIAAQEPPAGDGPRGSSQRAAGEARYDAVGFADAADSDGISAVSAVLPAGSYAEVTALDTGRTIVAAIVAGEVRAGHVVALSARAATALGLTGGSPVVRIRKVVPTAQDVAQLRSGQAGSFRADAPPALLAALRKMVPPRATVIMPKADKSGADKSKAHAAVAKPAAPSVRPPVAPIAPPRAKATPVASPSPRVTGGYVVQVAALSSAARAAVVARDVGGAVVAGPPVWRVRVGPFADLAAATRAKADAARKGYPGGQIARIP